MDGTGGGCAALPSTAVQGVAVPSADDTIYITAITETRTYDGDFGTD